MKMTFGRINTTLSPNNFFYERLYISYNLSIRCFDNNKSHKMAFSSPPNFFFNQNDVLQLNK